MNSQEIFEYSHEVHRENFSIDNISFEKFSWNHWNLFEFTSDIVNPKLAYLPIWDLFLSLLLNYKSGDTTINSAKKIMVQARFVDDSTIEVIAPDGEKFTWNTYFPVPKQNQQYISGRFAYYFQKYHEDENAAYWIWIKMTYDERLAISSGKGDREEERMFLHQERERIGLRIRELRKEKNIEAKMLAQIANIDAANLSRIEQGRYSVGLDVLSKIALALGAKIELTDFVEPKIS